MRLPGYRVLRCLLSRKHESSELRRVYESDLQCVRSHLGERVRQLPRNEQNDAKLRMPDGFLRRLQCEQCIVLQLRGVPVGVHGVQLCVGVHDVRGSEHGRDGENDSRLRLPDRLLQQLPDEQHLPE